MTNYQPISILLVISKLFEKAIYNKLHDFLRLNDLYNKNQYRFRKGQSTEHPALELVDRCISEMDNGDILLTIHMDLSKAFDSINHKILRQKLRYYGIIDKALTLFKS